MKNFTESSAGTSNHGKYGVDRQVEVQMSEVWCDFARSQKHGETVTAGKKKWQSHNTAQMHDCKCSMEFLSTTFWMSFLEICIFCRDVLKDSLICGCFWPFVTPFARCVLAAILAFGHIRLLCFFCSIFFPFLIHSSSTLFEFVV